ncbi:UDP-N-acetylmuramoyl-tripeptide--D-alanyl-D-alanine ligase [bacterium]|nr:UDP-N-acetylmuramoyl-tripeptide--D-alanyl-D-alanine ligase [bacterium]
MALMIHDILRWLPADVSIPDIPITGVSIDTRTLQSGDLFVALKGEHTDGHQFVDEALKKGACAALVSRSYPGSKQKKMIGVENPLKALQDIAAHHRKNFKGPVIAITGSNGKTTTKEMIAGILAPFYRIHKTEGNLNNHIGVPLTILKSSDQTELMVLEMGMNHPGEIRQLCEIARPTHGVIINVGRGHLGFFQSVVEIGRAKAELLESLRDTGTAFINGDDPILRTYRYTAATTIQFGFEKGCQVRAENITQSGDHPAMRIKETEFHLSVPGEHQLYNALAAVAVGLTMHIPLDQMVQNLAAFQSCPQRMEKIEVGGVTILNDVYNANPDSVMAALKTLSDLQASRRIAVLGDMLELGAFSEEEHVILGKQMRSMKIDQFFGVGPEMAKAVQSLNRNGSKRGYHFHHSSDIVPELSGLLHPGDVVLVKGSRLMHMEKIVEKMIEQIESGE